MVDSFSLLMKSCCYWIREVGDSHHFSSLFGKDLPRTKNQNMTYHQLKSFLQIHKTHMVSLGSKQHAWHYAEVREWCTPTAQLPITEAVQREFCCLSGLGLELSQIFTANHVLSVLPKGMSVVIISDIFGTCHMQVTLNSLLATL